MPKRLVALVLLTSFVIAVSASGAAQTARRGAWVDEVVIVEEASAAAAITRLEAGDIHAYTQSTGSQDLFKRTQASPTLGYERAYGSSRELTLNPYGPVLPDGRLNPFGVARIREAMNWLIDRDHIAKEIHGGLAVPRFMTINTVFPDYARLADVCRALERYYAHNPDLAAQVITEEMTKLGATLVGGKWQYKGKPVELIMLARIDDERKLVGDYVTGLLQKIGFTVECRYATGAEASPLWMSGKPEDGKWHIYTGGWISTVIARDLCGNFDYYYTKRGRADTLWQRYAPAPEFDAVADRLARRDFTSMEERKELFAKALELSLKDSVRVWTVDVIAFSPRLKEVRLAADVAGGLSGAYLWPHTLRVGDRVGGTVRMASPSVLTAPWNPVAGSNWIFDMMLIRATADWPGLWDPFTGLHWPQRLERAEVYIKKGLPVGRTLDWLTLTFVDENRVPADAWVAWDAKAQKFITVGTKYPEGLTANRKVVVRYPKALWQTKWHDGNAFSIGDVVLSIIMTFDRANPDSAIYDKAAAPAFSSFEKHFKGVKIVSRDPLVVEYYSDLYYPDAEWCAYYAAMFAWPYYDQGPGPWHTMYLSIKAETEKKLAFSSSKAAELKVDQTNLIAGPSLVILRNLLPAALREKPIPYEPTMKDFVTREESWARWDNLVKWYAEKGHLWVGNGPFYLEKAFPVEKVVQLKRFADFPDVAGKWDRFGAPPLASTAVTGPTRVTPGTAATFEVKVTLDGKAYATKDLEEVKFLVFDAKGAVALSGPATAVQDGTWRIALTAAQTQKLPVGTARVEAIVVSKLVSIPTFSALDIVIRR